MISLKSFIHLGWSFKLRETFAIHTKDEILQFTPISHLAMYPKGWCMCSVCKQLIEVNEKKLVYINLENEPECPTCKSPFSRSLTQVSDAPTTEELLKEIPFDLISNYTMDIDKDEDLPKLYAETAAKMMHVYPEYHYFDNKSLKDLYQDVLAKRVIRRFRKNVQRRHQRRVELLLYHFADIGKDGAFMLSKKVRM